MNIKTQTFLILGVSQSGYSAGKYILNNGGKCYLLEELDIPKTRVAISELTALGGVRLTHAQALEKLNDIDVVVISPGIPINYDIAVNAKKLGKRLVGELEFGFLQFVPQIIAVTGTNGKTTTVSLINHVLNFSGFSSRAVGNIGVPLTSELSYDKNNVYVTEVSSFQLESTGFFNPHIACVLNLTPDHLDRHYTMENYIFLKKKLLSNLRESEYAILNYDDEIVKKFSAETKAKVVWVSIKEEIDGAYIKEGNIYFKNILIASINTLPLVGNHNLYNILFAVASCMVYGAKTEDITKAILTFKGIPNRMEHVADKKGVKYINDSKATNTASTISAIKSMKEPTVLILGGSEKGEQYDDLFMEIKKSNVKHVVLTGSSRYKMIESAGRVGVGDVTLTADFHFAVKIASMFAEEGDVVLLSPACASFDAFTNYEERGKTFKDIVENFN